MSRSVEVGAQAVPDPSGLVAEHQSCVEILGVRVSALSLNDTAERIVRWAGETVRGDGARYVCATSVHGLVEAGRDASFRQLLNRASIVTADGMPLVWLGRYAGRRQMERVYGPTLMGEVCRKSAGRQIRHFFYGGAAGVAEQLAQVFGRKFPGLEVAGCYCPPFSPLSSAELDSVSALINRSGADVVWVGLSTPKQERWIASVHHLLKVKVVITVGAAFDFQIGRVRQAPGWMQQSGLEWLFRLSQEPRRLWKRYTVNNPVFMWRVLLQLRGLKTSPDSGASDGAEDE